MNKKIRVLIADDHSLFREMLFHTLSEEENIEVVGQAVDGKEALEMTRKLKPDILLLDITMPRMDGIEATEILSGDDIPTKIVILTAHDDDEHLFKLIKAGAIGYLMKDTSSEEVINAVHAAYSGESIIQPKVARKIINKLSTLLDKKDNIDSDYKKQLKQLTEREMEVFFLAGNGLNNKEIAGELFITEATVKTHIMNIMHKLNIRSRVELALFAVRSGAVKLGK